MRETAKAHGGDWRVTFGRRTLVAAAVLGCWVAGIEARLVYLQVIAHGDLVARAERQQKRTVDAPGKRGDILDRKGRVLATSADADSVYAVPTVIENEPAVAKALCEALGDCSPAERRAILERLGKQKNFVWVRRQVSHEQARRVAALNLDGVGFVKESRRFYPNKELAAHLLGYVGIDNTGLNGLESTYDGEIRGKNGTILIHTDARRQAFSRFERPPTSGSTLELTIDEYLQHLAERELETGVAESRAAGGSIIIMSPRTGEILAMANAPTFNPNMYRDAPEGERRNRAVQDLYEPGSTFKIVTASAALEEHVLPANAPIDVSGGQIRLGSRVVHDTHNNGVLSLADVIVKSSNVGAIKIGFRVGTERLSRYVQRFGFGRRISPDFPSENPGIVWAADRWTDDALASVSMGYQVGVTPLQMVTAVSSVANGGAYVEPRVVRAFYRDGRRYEVPTKSVRQTISPDTASTLTTIMEGVVERGTATAAQIPGYTIAGKTGTSHKLVNGRYSNTDYNASFVGFLPSRDPAVAIIVVVDSPRGGSYFGGSVSAPIFRRVAEATLRYLGIGPTVNPAAPVLVARRDDASDALGTTSASQEGPPPLMSLVSDAPAGTMPDLRNLSARDAAIKLARLGLTARMAGSGFVVWQEPPPGALLEPGRVGRLKLERVLTQRASE